MTKELAYSDVTLIPRKGVVSSRSECSTAVDFLGQTFKTPIIPANMKCSISFDIAVEMSRMRNFYILHRFYDYEQILEWIGRHQHLETISISIGVQEKDIDLVKDIIQLGYRVDYITIDVAHGHSENVRTALHIIHNLYRDGRPKLIAGNVCTSDGVRDLIKWGADAVKVGIGQGHVCTTRTQTGFGMPMFGCVHECSRWMYDDIIDYENPLPYVPIIADGGVYHYGDAAKAIVAGADMVMAGSMFARCVDSPAETVTDEHGALLKKWFGSASEENKGNSNHIEGIVRREPMNGLLYREMLEDWKQALQSSISYAGGDKLNALKYIEHAYV